MQTMELFETAIQRFNPRMIADELALSISAIKRWETDRRVPHQYKNDLRRLLGKKACEDLSAREKDQFFTKPEVAKYCFDVAQKKLILYGFKLRDYQFIEPSAGSGAFFDLLPKGRRLGIDIEPRGKYRHLYHKMSYFDFKPRTSGKYGIVGNPAFGLRGNLALRFINHSQFADFIVFILPPLFNSNGKGSPKKRVQGFTLAHSEALPSDSFVYPNGDNVDVATVLQIWVKTALIENKTVRVPVKKVKTCDKFIKIYSLSDGGTPGSTRNKHMLDACDAYLPSTTFQDMSLRNSFEDLPHRRGYGIVFLRKKRELAQFIATIDWSKYAFRSTNHALNLRTELIQQPFIESGYAD